LVGGSRPRDEPGMRISSVDEELALDLETALSKHDPDVLAMRLVPLLLAERSRRGEATLHLPPTCWVLGSLEPVTEALESRAVALFPRTLPDPPADGLDPRPLRLEQVGRICDRAMAVSGEPALEFLEWWAHHLEDALGPVAEKGLGASAESRAWLPRYLELAPSRFEALVIDDPG